MLRGNICCVKAKSLPLAAKSLIIGLGLDLKAKPLAFANLA